MYILVFCIAGRNVTNKASFRAHAADEDEGQTVKRQSAAAKIRHSKFRRSLH